MDRKWRLNRGAIQTVRSYDEFSASIPPAPRGEAEYTLSSTSDLYAVYTVLHIEIKQSELRWSDSGRFYYFLANWQEQPKAAVPMVRGVLDEP